MRANALTKLMRLTSAKPICAVSRRTCTANPGGAAAATAVAARARRVSGMTNHVSAAATSPVTVYTMNGATRPNRSASMPPGTGPTPTAKRKTPW